MTNQKRHFKKYLKTFIQHSLSSCKEEYLKNKQKYDDKLPVADFTNQTLTILHNDIIDYKKLIFSLKTTIENHPEVNSLFKIIKNILKTEINSIESKNNYKLDTNDNVVDYQLFYCLLYYLENYGYEFDDSNFNKTFSVFNKYLHQHFYNFCYLTPLYNFDGDFERCQISSNLWIRKIPCEFYSKIINLNLDIKDIPSYQRQLKYALFCSTAFKKNSQSPATTALENFENVLNALKLFERGDPRFGDIFGIDAEDWPGYGLKVIERGHERPPSSGKYYLNLKKSSNFKKFYEKLCCKTFELGKKSDFLKSSIRRYGMAAHHRTPVDMVVDYVICLESLLVPNVGDATLKMAHRMATLLGNSDVERLQIWKFAKEAYKFRSGYLHLSTERPFKIDSKHLELDKASDELERFSRIAIKRVIRLLDKYDSQDQIVNELDQSIYDRSKLTSLQKIWKSYAD